MTGTALLSHFQPTLHLAQHLEQVRQVSEALFARHSSQTRTQRSETAAVLAALVRGHDLGKGSRAFQDYIANPAHYRGDPYAKAHSALSAALMLLWARAQGWEALPTLALVQAIAGHHAGFATLDDLENRLRLDDDDPVLEQWATLDRQALEHASGLSLADTDGAFEAARRWLFRRQQVGERLQALAIADAVRFRLWTQLLFSLLLEADKAFLALRTEHLNHYVYQQRPELPPECVDARLTSLPDTPLNALRHTLRTRLLSAMAVDHPCCTLTLPTGTGKTLLAATWALTQRTRARVTGSTPKIIIALPFLSIIDQTEQEYRTLLGLNPHDRAQSNQLLASHSLSYSEYEIEGQTLGANAARFFLDTWQSEIVITTFDQLLLALFSPKTRHQMRFHALMDALIILDEVQTVPCRLWDLVGQALRGLTTESRTRILLMSATQPALLSGARELAGDPEQVAAVFAQFKRYRLRLCHRERQELSAFIQSLQPRLTAWCAQGKRVLITLNTRASAKAVWRAMRAQQPDIPVWLISADVTPRDRLIKIAAIKALSNGQPGIVVSTQTIEAGVDIDLDIVIRDFAPLDALIQIAGRCNRNNRLGDHGGQVEIVSLTNPRGCEYAQMVYDAGDRQTGSGQFGLLEMTREILADLDEIGEESVLELSRRYFDLIKTRKNTGQDLTESFARWTDMPDIRTLLRGRKTQIAFVVLDDDEPWLRDDLESALAIQDRWERRDAVRALAAAIQQRTVSVYAQHGFHPEAYADPLGWFWILKSGYYSPDSGLDFGDHDEEPATCIL